ncbi:NADP-dependent oxidoreductase domain-containing protein [Collybia nuda]|uniref:NADP-dependent oxidoreductase domain-containing protein n=1 Tax=Collybia nuda TaxID=64659 RepID=A0A9P6C8C3_9AGAR|nr:NADP-dependent oxidoreductase domain-containing protein [Collybia nuda]
MPVSDRKQVANEMQYVRLGSSGLKISQIILGCICFGSPEWRDWALPSEESTEIIKAAYDAGVNTFETSYHYSRGQSEIVLGEALRRLSIPRDSVVIMTRIGGAGPNRGHEGDRTQGPLSRKNIMNGVKSSLERLQMDYIDVLHCAYFDEETPIAETMRALHDVVQAGYVRYIGMAPCWAYQFHIMQNYAITHNLTPFISAQSYYSLVYREDEREMFPTMKHFGVGVIAIAPLSGKLLSRPYTETRTMDPGLLFSGGSSVRVVGSLERVVKSQRMSMGQVAVSWVLNKKAITATVISAPNLDVFLDYIDASKVKLASSYRRILEEHYQPRAPADHVSFGNSQDVY